MPQFMFNECIDGNKILFNLLWLLNVFWQADIWSMQGIILSHSCSSSHSIRSSLTTEASKTIASAIVGSHLDYCNSHLACTSTLNLPFLSLFRTSLLVLLLKNLVTVMSHQPWLATWPALAICHLGILPFGDFAICNLLPICQWIE